MKTLPGPVIRSASKQGISSSSHTCKFADQAFACAQIAEDATTRDALQDIIAVPRYEMTVVDDVFLALTELSTLSDPIIAVDQRCDLHLSG